MLKWIYKFSEKEKGTGTGANYPAPAKGFLWILATAPSEAEIKKLKADFGLKFTTRYGKERRSVRYTFSPLAFALVDYYLVNGGKPMKSNVLYWMEKNMIITLMQHEVVPYEDTYRRVKETLGGYSADPAYLLYDIIGDDAEENFDVLERIDNEITGHERDVMQIEKAPATIEKVILLKRELSMMTKVFWGSAKIIHEIRKGMTPLKLDAKMIRLFDDVSDTFIHQVDGVTSQKEMLSDIITIYETTISNRLAQISNKINTSIQRLTIIMLVLTGIGTVLTVPNTVATILGIPYLSSNYLAYILLALLVSTVIPLALFYNYWKKTIITGHHIGHGHGEMK